MESDIVERLRDDAEINEIDPAKLPSEWKILREAAAEIERLRAELAAAIKQRDEARREVCELRYTPSEDNNNIWYAEKRGWDCYEEKEGGGA